MNNLNPSYDLLVLGGGINGAAIARDASLRGLTVLLVDKNDFASGASSKSSKLIHGGLRYLEHFDFSLVKESLHERAILLRTAPYHVKYLPFLMPVYAGQKRPQWFIEWGLKLYDFLTPAGVQPHRHLSPVELLKALPGLHPNGLKGGFLYYDAQMRDNRLVFENIRSAEKMGAHALNYTQAEIISTNPYRVQLKSEINNLEAEVQVKSIVKAMGAWPAGVPLKPTKGVHLVLPAFSTHALTLSAPQDQRIFFSLPWNGQTLLGTTDTPFLGNPEKVDVEEEDIDYLLQAYNHYFPHKIFNSADVIASFAGVRPLVQSQKGSRRHALQADSRGIMTVAGGKYTTYRKLAEETVNLVLHRLHNFTPCVTVEIPLYADSYTETELRNFAAPLAIEKEITEHLLSNYGPAAMHIFKKIQINTLGGIRMCLHHPHPLAELIFAMEEEHVRTPGDWFERRTSIAYTPCKGLACYETVKKHMSNKDQHHRPLSAYPRSRMERG